MMKQLTAFAIVLAICSTSPAQSTWTAFATGGWATASNWDVPPTSGATTQLVFNGILDAAYTADNDTGVAPFILQGITINNQAGGALTVANAAANSIQFAAGGGIAMNGPGAAVLSGTTVDLVGGLSVTGSGAGALTISSQITGATGSLTINRTDLNYISTIGLTSTTANTFAGGVTVQSGILSMSNSANLGAGTLTVATTGIGYQANGEVRMSATGQTINNPITVNNGATYNVTTGSTYVIGSAISGQGGFNIGSYSLSNAIPLEGANTYSGTTTATFGNLTLRGTTGALANSLTLNFFRNSSLTLDSNAATTGTGNTAGNQVAQDRVNDNAVVNFHRSNLTLTANTAATTTETIGTLNNDGWGIFTLTPQTAAGATLTINNLNLVSGGTIEIRSASLGVLAPGTPNSGNLMLTNFNGAPVANALVGGGGGAGTTNISIFQKLTGNNAGGTATGLVTYDATNGVRLLDTTTEYAISLPVTTYQNAAQQNNNVRATGNLILTNQSGNAPMQTNALLINGVNAGVYGFGGLNGRLNIRSGALINATATGFVGLEQLQFNGGEAVITAAGTLVVNSAITNNTGVTISGASRTSLVSPNSVIGGPITMNFGTLQFSNQAQLGGATSINFNGGFIDLSGLATGTSDTLSTPLNFGPAGGIIRVRPLGINNNGTSQSWVLSGAVTGSGPFQVNTSGLLGINGGGTLVLNGDATAFSGPMIIVGGTVQIDSAARLGTNPFLSLGSTSTTVPAQLHVTSTTSTTKNFQLNGLSFIRTDAGATFTVSGFMTGTQAAAAFRKLGAGELLLTNEANYGGATSVGDSTINFANVGGTLRLRDNGAIVSSSSFTVTSGSALIADNTGSANLGNRLNNVTTNLAGGTLQLLGSSSASSREIVGPMTLTANTGSLVEVVPGAGQTAALFFSGPTNGGFVRNNGSTVTLRSPGLGGTGAGQGQINFIHNTAAPTGPALTNGILAHTFGEDGATLGLTTVDTVAAGGGLPQYYRSRLLTAGEYALNAFPNTGVQTTNERLTAAAAPTGSPTVNSAFIDAGGSLTIGAGQTVTLTSGTVIMAGGTSMTGGTVTLPAAGDLSIYVGTGTASLGSDVNLQSTTRFLDKAGPGTLSLTTAWTTNAPSAVNIQRGTFQLGTGGAVPAATVMNIESGSTFDVNGAGAPVDVGAINGLGTVNLGTTAGTVLRIGGANAASTFGGTISGTGSIEKVGTGILTFQSTANYAGPITVSAGTLRFGNASGDSTRIPIVSGGLITAADGTTITFANVEDFARPVNIDVGAAAGTVTFNNGGGFGTNTRISGAIFLAANKTVNFGGSTSGFTRFSSNISGDGNVNYASVVQGIVDGNNTYTGTTTITSGTLQAIGSDTAYGNGGVVTVAAATNFIAFGGDRTITNPINLNGNPTFGTTLAMYQGFNLTFAGDVTMNAARTITTTAAGRLTLTNLGGGFGITKAGGGTLALAGSNITYTGTTAVNAGTLLVNGTMTAGGGAITVATAAAIGGTGVINRDVSVGLLASISPGQQTGPGDLTVNGNLTLQTNSVYYWKLTSDTTAGPGTNWDRISMTSGDLTIQAGALLIPAFTGTTTGPTNNAFWTTDHTWDNIINLTGTATNSSGAAVFTIDNSTWASLGAFSTLPATTGSGVRLVWTAVPIPEPLHVMALCAASAGAFGWYRRRRGTKN